MGNTVGQVLTIASRKSQECANCDNVCLPKELKQCSFCKETLYCSRACQKQHWTEHKRKCTHLTSGGEKSPCNDKSTRYLPPPVAAGHTHKVTSLVGRQHLIECYLIGHQLQALWDTGSQVSITDEAWKTEYLSNARLRDVSEILDSHDDLILTAANGTEMPYLGWIETTFKLASETDQRK